MSNRDILRVCILGYGVAIQYRIDDFTGIDGTLDKHSIRKSISWYSNPYLAITIFYNYNLIFRLLLDRD